VTLRLRIAVGMGLVAVVLAVMGVRAMRTTESALMGQVDATLTRSIPRLRLDGPAASPGPSPLWVAAVNEGKLRVVAEPDLTEGDPGTPDIDVATALAALDQPPFTVDAIGAPGRYRVQVRSVGPRDRPVVLGAPLEGVDATVRKVRNHEILRMLVVLGTLGLVAYWVDRLGLRPIRQMTTTAQAIAEGDRTQRVPSTRAGTEAAELGDALNHMLTRLAADDAARAASEARLRQFVADASHELRTPLATIAGYAELHRMGGLEAPGQFDDAMRRTEQETARMTQLVDEMLDLARLDQGRPLTATPTDLAQVLRDSAIDAAAVEPGRPIDVDCPETMTVPADEARIRQVIANLVGNVRVHTSPDTALHLRLRSEDGWAILEVIDHGPGMDHETAARAFERFYRADSARTRATGGSGLGLSIVAAVVSAHRGHVRIVPTPGGGTTVQIALPLDPGPGGPASSPDSRQDG